MSPTLLEGVVIFILLIVAWQIGIRLAPIIFAAIERAADQLRGIDRDADRKADAPQKSLTDKESPFDQP